MSELYEDIYKNKTTFSFGKNWQDFLAEINLERIRTAEKSLTDFLNGEVDLSGKSFIDVGCGSGLFSLGAYNLGCKTLTSMDVDEYSVECANQLKRREGVGESWRILHGSALDVDFVKSLGTFDIVYSWGVLHHSGDMKKALENLLYLVHPQSYIYLAIYNNRLTPITSKQWWHVKRLYSKSPVILKRLMIFLYTVVHIFSLIVRLKNPFSYIKEYGKNRGMSYWTDRKDWVGGFPYEYAKPEEIINFFGKRGLACVKMTGCDGIGCNEFLFAPGKNFAQLSKKTSTCS